MGKLIGNVALLVAGFIVLTAELLAVSILFVGATFIVISRRITHLRPA